MSHPISTLRIHANTTPFCLEQIKKCFDPITQFVLNIFRQIADFFYNLFHKKPNNLPELPRIQNPVVIPQEETPVKVETVNHNNPAELPIVQNPLVIPEEAPVKVETVNRYGLSWDRSLRVDSQTMISFYRGEATNHGLALADFLSENGEKMKFENFDFDDNWLLAFPTEILSSDIPIGPLLNKEDFKTFLKDPLVRDNIVKVFKRVLAYFGLQLNEEHEIEKGPNFEERAKYWITYNNHNYYRIARIIVSLMDMQKHGDLSPKQGSRGYAAALVECLKKIYQDNQEEIDGRPFMYWWNLVFH